MKKEKIFLKKCLQFEKRFDIIIKPKGHGRLAQLVEHLLDVQRVRDSSSLPSTTQGAQLSVLFFCFIEFEKWQELESRKGERRTENFPVAGFSAGCREGRKAERRGAARLGGAVPSSLPSTTQGAQSSVLFFCIKKTTR